MAVEKDVSEKKKVLSRRLIVIIVVSVLVIASILSFIFYMGKMEPPCAIMRPPQISAEVTDMENGTYRVNLTEVDASHIDGCSVDVGELRVSIVNGNQTLILRNLTAVLNNTSSNLTFYDMDGDGTLSAGDEFIVRGNLAVAGYELDILDRQSGDLLKAIPLEPSLQLLHSSSERSLTYLFIVILISLLFVLVFVVVASFIMRKRDRLYRKVFCISLAILLLVIIIYLIIRFFMIDTGT